MSILNKLTEGIVNRDLSKDGAALINKWEQTGLLEGLDDYNRNSMSVLLENQAKELLKETTTMAAGFLNHIKCPGLTGSCRLAAVLSGPTPTLVLWF